MPLLRRLLPPEELGDAPANATAEQLFASSIYAQEMRTQRQQAAALCSAPLVAMSTLAVRNGSSSVLGNELERLKSCSVEQCVHTALLVAREGQQALFLVRDPKGVTKRLAAALKRPDAAITTELAAECLHRVHFRQCRSVYELLCELDHEQQSWQDGQNGVGTRFVVLGPLCDLFSGFQTASGITATEDTVSVQKWPKRDPGAGLKRMLELAIQRLRATTNIYVSVMEAETS